ncbi:MAG: hypothetical protein AAB343_03125 [Patescibacteria group bacterium]
MKKFARYITPVALAIAPALAFAQTTQRTEGLFGIIADLDNLFTAAIALLIVLATLLFIWGLISYLMAGPDEDKSKEARKYMLYGIVSLAVIIAMWGLANLLLETFGVDGGDIPNSVGDIL